MISLKHKLIIVGVPIFNEEAYLNETLNSLADQSYKDFLVLLSDNNSTDSSKRIAESFIANDKRFHLHIHSKNLGSIGNFRFICEVTHSPFLMILGAHDLLCENYLEELIAIISKDESVSHIYSAVSHIDENSMEFKQTNGGSFLFKQNSPLQRYFACISQSWGECTAVNGIFRRNVFNSFQLPVCYGPDHILLSRSQFFGYSHMNSLPLYKRRHFPRETTYFQRILSKDYKVSSSLKSYYLKSFWSTASAHIINYFSLPLNPVTKTLNLFPLLYSINKGYNLISFLGLLRLLKKRLIRHLNFHN